MSIIPNNVLIANQLLTGNINVARFTVKDIGAMYVR
jgi:hypothetical protein